MAADLLQKRYGATCQVFTALQWANFQTESLSGITTSLLWATASITTLVPIAISVLVDTSASRASLCLFKVRNGTPLAP